MALLSALEGQLDRHGLVQLGSFNLDPEETLEVASGPKARAVLIVGNAGSALWQHYARAREEARPEPLSLDRWTRQVIDPIARDGGGRAVYPFEGPPFQPFTRWAIRSGMMFASPLGLTLHPTFGLWHAFRAAILLPEALPEPAATGQSPCETCAERPCRDACPVAAFSSSGYDFARCLDHVAGPGETCRGNGCLARAACPIGQDYRYLPEHAAFHMGELLRAHGRKA
jgi:hypothetical protein